MLCYSFSQLVARAEYAEYCQLPVAWQVNKNEYPNEEGAAAAANQKAQKAVADDVSCTLWSHIES